MPNKVLENFPWVRTDPIPVSPTSVPRPKTIWELKDNPLRPVYISLFLDWLAGQPDPERTSAAARMLLACWDVGLAYDDKAKPDNKTLPWQKYNGLVAMTTLGTWDSAAEWVTKAAALYAGDFNDELQTLKGCVRDNKADAEAAARGFLADSIAKGGDAEIVAMIAALGPVKQQINSGINKLAILQKIDPPWKDYDKVIAQTVGKAILAYGDAEGNLRNAIGEYQKNKPKPADPGFDQLLQKVTAYNDAAQKLGASVQQAAAAAAAHMNDTAKQIATENFARVLPEVAEGLLVFDTCMYLFIGMLSAATPACPPLIAAVTALTIAQKAIDKAVVSIKVNEYLKNKDVADKLLMVKREKEKGSVAAKAAEIFTTAYDYEQIGEGIADTVFLISDQVIKTVPDGSRVKDVLSNASAGWAVYTGATALSTGVVSTIVGGFEMAKTFADYDSTPFEIEHSEQISKGLKEIRALSENKSLPSRSYIIHDRVSGSDGVYKVTIGGVTGTLNVITQQFTPADFEATFNAFAPKAKASAADNYRAGSAPDTYDVAVTSVIDLKNAKRERYDVREARLVLTASITHTVDKVPGVFDADPLPRGAYRTEEKAVKVYLDSDGALTRDSKLPVLAPPQDWLKALYIPLRYRYPLRKEASTLDKDNHPYLRLGYGTIEDTSGGKAALSVVKHTEKMPVVENDDFESWWNRAMIALEQKYKDTGRAFNDPR